MSLPLRTLLRMSLLAHNDAPRVWLECGSAVYASANRQKLD